MLLMNKDLPSLVDSCAGAAELEAEEGENSAWPGGWSVVTVAKCSPVSYVSTTFLSCPAVQIRDPLKSPHVIAWKHVTF